MARTRHQDRRVAHGVVLVAGRPRAIREAVVEDFTRDPGLFAPAKMILIQALRREGRESEIRPPVEKWLEVAVRSFPTRPASEGPASVGTLLGIRACEEHPRRVPQDPNPLRLIWTTRVTTRRGSGRGAIA